MTAPALLLIDVQKGLDEPSWGRRSNPDAERQIERLLAAWRDAGWPVIHVQHMSQSPDSPLHPDAPGNAIKDVALPIEGEPLFQKQVNSGFIGTDLEAHLRAEGIRRLVIAGLTTDHCVSTTTRMAGNLGFEAVLVGDATATFERTGPDGTHYTAEQMHETALASLHGEFAEVTTADRLLEGMAAFPPIEQGDDDEQ
jgi:nicotinamidase-related amidase